MMRAPAERGERLLVLIPVYEDWGAVEALLYDLDEVLERDQVPSEVLLIDDGSKAGVPDGFLQRGLRMIEHVDVVQLKRNLGHQRAIAIGLVFAAQHRSGHMVLVMDGDGEDGPCDVPALLDHFRKHGGTRIVFAERTKRSEAIGFKVFYRFYKWLHRILTGVSVRVGNFSVIPFHLLRRMVVVSEIWNHYAAAVFNAKFEFTTVAIPRRRRLAGQSRMNFVALVVHGLSAISVYGQVVGVRLLAAAAFFILAVFLSVGATIAIRLLTNLAIPGWATYTAGLLMVMMLQAVAMSFLLIFMILYSRSSASIIPVRDCPLFIDGVKRVYPP